MRRIMENLEKTIINNSSVRLTAIKNVIKLLIIKILCNFTVLTAKLLNAQNVYQTQIINQIET